jgi:hypothetical protein
MSRKKRQRLSVSRRDVLHFTRGSPVRSMRWKSMTWDRLYEMEHDHKGKVKVNRIAEVAVNWGLAFLRTLDPQLRGRILGGKGEKALTFEERDKLRSDLERRLGTKAGAFRLDNRLAFALPTPAKQLIREEAERAQVSMSAIARKRIILQETA